MNGLIWAFLDRLWHLHTWPPWSAPESESWTRHYPQKVEFYRQKQTRRCETCGEVRIRYLDDL